MKIWKIQHIKTKLFYGKGRWKWRGKVGSYKNTSQNFYHRRFYKEGGNIYQKLQYAKLALKNIKNEHSRYASLLKIVEFNCKQNERDKNG